MSNRVIAVILGGGKGTRLHPLTQHRAKPAVPIAGKYRLVDIPISNCLNSGYNHIFVLTQYNSASLNSHIKNAYNFTYLDNAFVEILAAEQTNEGSKWFSGNADAVRHLQRYLAHVAFDYLLVLSGDQLYQMDLQELVNSHCRSKAQVTVATTPVTAREACLFGILKARDDGRVQAFIEKPNEGELSGWASPVDAGLNEEGRHYLASMGIYVFNRDALEGLLTEPHTDFGSELIPHAVNTMHVNSYLYDGYWTDIGNISSFFQANIALSNDLPRFNLFDKYGIYTRARMLPPSKIGDVKLNKTIIADGCIIEGGDLKRSVVGIRSRIGQGTTLQDVYMMGADSYQTLADIAESARRGTPRIGVGENCHIEWAILDKNCSIGHHVKIKGGAHLEDGDYGSYAVSDGVIVIKKWAVLPDYTIIGG